MRVQVRVVRTAERHESSRLHISHGKIGVDPEVTVSISQSRADAPQSAEPGRYDAFLSYAREESDFAVGWLLPALRERGSEVWVDVDIPGGAKWRERVERGIEACKALIFVVSPASVASEPCGEELAVALALNKLVIPVVRRDVPERDLPAALAALEWVFVREVDDPAAGLDRLTDALQTDLEWRDQHTRLAGKAREWLDAEKNVSYLLRGPDLRAAEAWFADQTGHREAPTREQGEYIARSRQAAGRRVYIVVGVLSIGLAIAIGLAVFAWIQRKQAIHQTHAAQSRALAASSLLALDTDPEVSLLLAREAVREQDTPQARGALRNALASSHVRRTMRAPIALGWAWFTPDGRRVVANGIGPSYIFDASSGRLVKTLYDLRYQRPMFKSELSADGSRFLILPNIGPPVVMDMSGRTPPAKLADPTDSWFSDAALAPNGRTAVASTLHSNIARVFDASTGRVLRTLPGHGGRVAFSPDGEIIAVAGDVTVTTYDMAGARLARLPVLKGAGVYARLVFSPNGELYAATEGETRAWDARTGRPRARLMGLRPDSGGIASAWPLAFSRDGAVVAGVTTDGEVSIWNARNGRVRTHIVAPPDERFYDVALSPNGQYVATADSDGVARIWSTANGALISELRGVTGGVNHVVFAPDGKRVLTAGEDGTARIWDPGLGLPDRRWSAPEPIDGTMAGRWALAEAASGERSFEVLDTASGRKAFSVRLSAPVDSLVFAARAAVVAVMHERAPAELWDMSRRRSLGTLPGTAGVAAAVRAVSPDGRLVLTAAGDRLTIWDVSARRAVARLRHHVGGTFFPTAAYAFSPDDQLLAGVGTDGVVLLWHVPDGRVIAREPAERSPGFNGSDPVAPAFSADSSLFTAAGNWDRSPGVWRTSNGQLVSRLTQSFNTVAFSPNAPLIVTDGAYVFDAQSGRRLLTLRDPRNGLQDAAFTADGLHVIADAFDTREIFSCDVCGSVQRLLRLAAQRTTRDFTAAERDRYLR